MATKKTASAQVEKLMYGKEDAAFALSISVRSIEAMLADRRLNGRRFGRRILIPASDVKRVAALIERSDMLQGVASSRD